MPLMHTFVFFATYFLSERQKYHYILVSAETPKI